MKKRRNYNTLGRRYLAMLATGERKLSVLIGLAGCEKRARSTLDRLVGAGQLVEIDRGRAGLHYALNPSRP